MNLPAVFAGRRRLWLLRLAANGGAQAAAALALSYSLSSAVDAVSTTAGVPARALSATLAFAAAMVVAVAALRWLERADAERIAQHYIYRVRQRILRVLWALPTAKIEAAGRGTIVLRFVGDMSAIGQWVGRGIARLASASLLFGGVLAGLAWRDWRLAAMALATMLLFVAIAALAGPRLLQAVRDLRRRRAQLASHVTEQLAAHATVQSSGDAHRAMHRTTLASRRVRDAAILVGARTGFFEALLELLVLAAPVAALLLITYVSARSTASAGEIVGIMSLFAMLATPLRELGRVFEYAQRAWVARAKIASFLAQSRPVPAAAAQLARHAAGAASVVLENASCEPALIEVSAVAAPGARISVGGAGGSGRSTLLGLLLGQRLASAGRVLVAEHNVARRGGGGARIAWISPDLTLLRGPLTRNLPRRAARCGPGTVDRLMQSLPQGWQTRLTDGGSNLSSGERLRIAVARLLLSRPQLILIDDAGALGDELARTALREYLATTPATVIAVDAGVELLGRIDATWLLERGQLRVLAPSPATTLPGLRSIKGAAA